MSERLRQLRFDEQFHALPPLNVSPAGFTHLPLPLHPSEPPTPLLSLDRFVRQVQEPAWATSPQEVAEYLLSHIYTPFDH